MRKLIYLLVGLFIIVLLQGCSSREEAPVPSPSIDSEAPPAISEWLKSSASNISPGKPITLGFSQLGSESAWRLANTASVRDAAAESGIRLIMKNAEQSQTKQFDAIRSFIQLKVDVIAIAPVVESGWEDILLEIKQAGIPVVILDRSVDVKDTSLFVTTIGSNLYEEGVRAGKYLLDFMRSQPGPIRIAELQGTKGSTPSIQRGEGFRSVIQARKDMVITQSAPAEFTEEKGREVMRTFLEVPEKDRPQVLFAHNDDMALGAIESIEEAGLRPGVDITVISVDGSRKALQQLAAGKLNAVVECNPLLGPQLMQTVKEIMAGRTLPKRMVPPEDVFTQERAAQEISKRKF
ncbi:MULTISPECIES: ABC transporter substrate-binding protein [unclassified Paenibacillus]|uniref:ABC transporter substrate-binding protein n=1 Tax=unclassified Paenibacillus TaxID=185978 RepID=UPI001043AEF9|nr:MULTISPECIES: ABC transporter substrate-binding protein [unclassified Paenibacillus]NIK68719.1 simple sugar transport system substrate-binding protein [Paenibacillus sp. BK720]TCM98996.1 monosaccharide ABC transporter substrate-binding protein (CUT2 family) [Paenibacillus sp. BK033]